MDTLCHARKRYDSAGPSRYVVCHARGPHTVHRAWADDGRLVRWDDTTEALDAIRTLTRSTLLDPDRAARLLLLRGEYTKRTLTRALDILTEKAL